LTELEINEQSPQLIHIAKPNIGNPLFLETDQKLKKTKFIVKLLMVSELTNSNLIENEINNDIKLIPILDYKLELKFLLDKKKKQEKRKRKEIKRASKKKRGFLRRLFGRKKKGPSGIWRKQSDLGRLSLEGEQIAQEIESIKDDLEKLQPRIYRGDIIRPKIISIDAVTPLEIHNMAYLHEQERPQSFLIKHRAFGTAYFYYRVVIEFIISEDIIEFLKSRNFVMFDVVLDNKTNYHSIVISKQNWNNLRFIQATDLHIAERNDRIFGLVKSFNESKFKRGLDQIAKDVKKLSKKKEEKILSPLRKRLINPNNQFRKFVKLVNRQVLRNELDFIVLTGDLIDFTLLSKLKLYSNLKEMKKFLNFKYKDSNWQIFRSILLNKPYSEKLKGVLKGQEILCPIFTIPGNHDYRPYAYDLKWAGMYKKIGLNTSEAAALKDMLDIFPLTSITKTPLALKGYWTEVNAAYDYYFKLGNNIFIFLDTGSDSFKNVRDLLAGHPSLTGLLPKQIGFLENIINYKFVKGDNIFLFVHGPPINTGEKRSIIKRIQKFFGKPIKTQIDEFKESLNRKLGKKSRIDGKFNVKYGTISRNWEKLIKFCKDFCVLTLSGHTHRLREYKLKDPDEKTRVFDAPPFSLKKIENPAAVYYDIYSEIHTNAKSIEENGPFVVQTPALGLGGYKNPKLAGAYRVVDIKNKKLSSFKVEYLSR